VKLRLDIDKAIAATAYLIQKAGGRYDVFVLMKTICLADRTALIKHGRTITGDRLVSMDKGPIVSGIYDLIKGKEVRGHPDALTKWKKCITERQVHTLRLRCMPELGFLSVREIGTLDAAFQTISEIPPYWLSDWMRLNFQEWEDPKGSSVEIDPARILKTAKKSDEEIEEINEEISSVNLMKAFLGA
jgi:hypothetical protein